jgi:3'-phosphoadenosine 5'-phosphosulfate (PAPS) 3'-phosphatase
MLERELETAIRLAREAGHKVLEYYAREIVAEEKLGIDNFSEPVTAADRASSRIIVTGLTTAFPGDFVLSEEELDAPAERTDSSRVWITDPIDGTWGFIKKDGDFAIQIGLAVDGEPVVGVVYLPPTNACITVREQRIFRRGGRQRTGASQSFEQNGFRPHESCRVAQSSQSEDLADHRGPGIKK